ncbi:unnamed protein product, partial [marine sediment metagenome]
TEKKKFLNSITLFSSEQIPQDLITRMPQISDLENILIFLDTELKDIYAQALDCELEIRDLKNKVETLKRELSQISGVQRKLKRSIIVELEALKEGTTDLKVSYLVKGASWNPIYDARANFEKSEVELVSYGVISSSFFVTGDGLCHFSCHFFILYFKFSISFSIHLGYLGTAPDWETTKLPTISANSAASYILVPHK